MKTFSFELNNKRYVVEYVADKGFKLFAEVAGQWKQVAGYTTGVLRPSNEEDRDKLASGVFGDRYEVLYPGAVRRALKGFFLAEESLSFKAPRFTEITDPALISALAKLQALCRAEGIVIQGDFTVWVGDVGYDQIDHLSGKEQTHWNRSKGQVKT